MAIGNARYLGAIYGAESAEPEVIPYDPKLLQ